MIVESVPVDSLVEYPGNPRRGFVPGIMESIKANGLYKPIVVQKSTRTVLAGNHTLQATRELGMTEIDVVWADVDDDVAKRIVLVDNVTNDKATYDFAELERLLLDMGDLAGTGYTTDDLKIISERASDLAGLDDGPDQSDRSELLNAADLLDKDPDHKCKHGEVWKVGPHLLIVGWPHKDWPLWAPFLTDPERDAPMFYPDIFITASDLAREKRLVLVQPRPLLAGHTLDAHVSMFPTDEVTLA